MKRILITGGAGFIGSTLSLSLLKKGYQVTVLDNLSPQIHGDFPEKTSPLFRSISGRVTFIKGSVTDKIDLAKALKDQDAIIHLAAETGTGQSMYKIKRYIDVNIGGTALLLDFLTNEKHNIQKVIVASSRAIYGEGKYWCKDHGVVFPKQRSNNDLSNGDFECKCPVCQGKVKLQATCEESRIHPTSIYGITKQNQEEMVLLIGKALNIPTVAFRYQNVYGPGQSLSNPYTGILSIFSTLIKNNKSINVFEDGKESRDFVFIDDIVEATILGLEKPEANYEVFNVGSDIPVSVIKVAQTLKNHLYSKVDINITGNYRIGDIRHNYADLKKIKEALGYAPKVSFDQGIARFVDWVNTQKIKSNNFEASISEMKQKGLFK